MTMTTIKILTPRERRELDRAERTVSKLMARLCRSDELDYAACIRGLDLGRAIDDIRATDQSRLEAILT